MHTLSRGVVLFLCLVFAVPLLAADASLPTWWAKYQILQTKGGAALGSPTLSVAAGPDVDVSNECGPQSETYIALDTRRPAHLAAGSNEIFRLPMRGYFSRDSGASWGGVDLPLPAAIGANGTRFGSDPSLAFDTQGNVFYSYIVVFFGNGSGINGTEMAVARSSDGGRSYPAVDYFSFSSGSDHFNDKPMIAADANAGSPYKDNVYVAWDAASGGSSGGGIRLGRSIDHGASFTTTRIDDPHGPGQGIGAVPFVGPRGEVYAAWNDYAAHTIAFNRSLDGGVTWDRPSVVAPQSIGFQIAVPAQSFRGALIYPSCDADRSIGVNRGRLYCSWIDVGAFGRTDVFTAYSDDQGSNWSKPRPAADTLDADRFNHWLAVDPTNGDVNLSFYDTRNDKTGNGFATDVYFTQSADGKAWLSPNVRVTTASSNEHDCSGTFPCSGIDYGNQYGDYEGLASFGGVSHPIWTDSRNQLSSSSGCSTDLAMEEVFTSAVN